MSALAATHCVHARPLGEACASCEARHAGVRAARAPRLARRDTEPLTGAFERIVRALGLPEPVYELHFDFCCEHPRREHIDDARELDLDYRAVGALYSYCMPCVEADASGSKHAYRRGRAWRFDAAWPDRMLAVELEGGVHVRGRHVTGTGYEADLVKYNGATILGWRVLRVSARHLADGQATEWLEQMWRVSAM